MEGWKISTAKSLEPMLTKFLLVSSLTLQSVWGVRDEGCLDRLILDFGKSLLVITVDKDDDSIDFWVEGSTDSERSGWVEVSGSPPWSEHVTKLFGWGWITVNQQGYCDGLLLGFGDIGPHIVLNVIASSINVAAIARLSAS